MSRKWRCERCGCLLGICKGDKLHVRVREQQYLARGEILAVCRRCSRMNEIVTAASAIEVAEK